MSGLTAGGTGQSGQVIPSADHCFFCLLGQSVGFAVGGISSVVNVKTVLKEGNVCFMIFFFVLNIPHKVLFVGHGSVVNGPKSEM